MAVVYSWLLQHIRLQFFIWHDYSFFLIPSLSLVAATTCHLRGKKVGFARIFDLRIKKKKKEKKKKRQKKEKF